MIADERLAELKAIAEKATQGRWLAGTFTDGRCSSRLTLFNGDEHKLAADMSYLAALYSEVVEGLLEELLLHRHAVAKRLAYRKLQDKYELNGPFPNGWD